MVESKTKNLRFKFDTSGHCSKHLKICVCLSYWHQVKLQIFPCVYVIGF